MNNNSKLVTFLYGNMLGRCFLKLIMQSHLERPITRFLHSGYSKPLINRYIKKHDINLTPEEQASYRSFRDFFARRREHIDVDYAPKHLISPCDGWLSAFPINEDSSFSLKNSHYRLQDFLQDEELAKNYLGGTCLIFRLCVSDYHRYCYIDDGYLSKNNYINGMLHSVQPIACEKVPVFVLNRRSWCLLTTKNFGPVVQCEIGALAVGGIFNKHENTRFVKGAEKGHFELAGSTIILLFEPGMINLKDEISAEFLLQEEVRVLQGQWIGNALN